MNLFVVLFIALIALALIDFLLADYPKIGQHLYSVALVLTTFVFSIKYYFGPDITSYCEWFDSAKKPLETLLSLHWHNLPESAFFIYISLCKWLGGTLWIASLGISLLYFGTINALFRNIARYKTFALLLLATLDYNLMAYEFRQCFAVALLVLAVLQYGKRRYVATALLVGVALLMHKSAIFVVLIGCVALLLRHTRFDIRNYWVLLVLLIGFAIIPLDSVIALIANSLPLPPTAVQSILHHTSASIKLQSVLGIYLLVLLCLSVYTYPPAKAKQRWPWLVFIGFLLVVIFYQYWFFLNRIRSYFLPFMLVYCINTLHGSPDNKLAKQLLTIALLLNCGWFTYSYAQGLKKPENQINATSTVFQRLHHSEAEIKARQLQKAHIFWKHYEEYYNKK